MSAKNLALGKFDGVRDFAILFVILLPIEEKCLHGGFVVSEEIKRLSTLRVTVDDVIYMPSIDAPEDRPHPFVYFLTIHNDGNERVHVQARKWVLEQADGIRHVVEGEGVVGQRPEILPDGTFSYNSYHVVKEDSKAEGAFLVETPSKELAYVPIPEFELSIPRWA